VVGCEGDFAILDAGWGGGVTISKSGIGIGGVREYCSWKDV